jgi:hypothetical protein
MVQFLEPTWRGRGRPPLTRRVLSRRSLIAAAIGATFLAVSAPQTAIAHWTRVSSHPSSAVPYFVCPPQQHRPRCSVIADPTRGSRRLGPVGAGAITAGPALEASPALEGGGVEGGYSPENLRAAYDLSSSSAGAGQTVAIVDAFNDPRAESDLAVYRSQYNLPPCTEGNGCFREVNEEGGKVPEAENNSEWATEISLDLDMVSAVCPNCHILLVEASDNLPEDFAAAEDEAVKLGATEISNSFAAEESSEPPQDAAAYDHPGIPITAAAGDHGYGVASPASNPDVIAVGGSALVKSGRRGWSESVWYEDIEGRVSETGSGCSTEPKPAWQKDAGCRYRTMNDVAAVADPNTPVSAYDSYESSKPWRLLGGTSAAAPIVAAAMALTNAYTRSFEGAEALYLAAEANDSAFTDIVSGSNGSCTPPAEHAYLCTAELGYDGPTGLGSLHGAPELPPPTPETETATAVGEAEATLNATVNPHGGEVDACRFEYGRSTSYGSSVPCDRLPGSGTGPVAVSVTLRGLAAGTEYHFRITVEYRGGPGREAAGYEGGAGSGADASFTTVGRAPSAVSEAASTITETSATLTGEVDPNGGEVEACSFEYGSTTSYGSLAPCSMLPAGSGETPVAVSASVGSLSPDSEYHFRVVASNHAGSAEGFDRTMWTLPTPPVVIAAPPSGITQASATLNATVDPGGGTVTSCEFEFNTSEFYVPCAVMPGAGAGPVAVSASVDGLEAGTAYQYRLVATNASGTTYGAIETFTTAPPLTILPSPIVGAADPPPVSSPQPAPVPDAELADTRLVVGAAGAVTVSVSCPAGESSCIGTIALRTLHAISAEVGGHPAAKRVLTLATGRFVVAGGRVVGLALHLSAQARSLLARSGVLRARAVLLAHDRNGASHDTQITVTIRSAATPRRRSP